MPQKPKLIIVFVKFIENMMLNWMKFGTDGFLSSVPAVELLP